jgi:hypothetical protein
MFKERGESRRRIEDGLGKFNGESSHPLKGYSTSEAIVSYKRKFRSVPLER